jgi:hypothetical protein
MNHHDPYHIIVTIINKTKNLPFLSLPVSTSLPNKLCTAVLQKRHICHPSDRNVLLQKRDLIRQNGIVLISAVVHAKVPSIVGVVIRAHFLRQCSLGLKSDNVVR